MQEDAHVEPMMSVANISSGNKQTTSATNSQTSIDFEMIDEGALLILTDGAEESIMAGDEIA